MPILKAHKDWYEALRGHSLPVLSIRQPWLHAILYFDKWIENRDYSYIAKGGHDNQWILLHASNALSKQEYMNATESYPEHKWPAYSTKDRNESFGLGCIHAIVRLKRNVRASNDKWFCGPYGWQFDRMLRLHASYGTVKGNRGLWYLPHEDRRKVLDLIERNLYDVLIP